MSASDKHREKQSGLERYMSDKLTELGVDTILATYIISLLEEHQEDARDSIRDLLREWTDLDPQVTQSGSKA